MVNLELADWTNCQRLGADMCCGTSASLLVSPFKRHTTFTHLPHYQLTLFRSIHNHETQTGTR